MSVICQWTFALRCSDAKCGRVQAPRRERAGDAIAEFVNDVSDRLTECGSHAARESNQYDSGGRSPTGIGEQAEILVFGQKHSRFGMSHLKDRLVLTGFPSITRGFISMRSVKVMRCLSAGYT